ncbi:MAG: ribonuclease R [Deltaproteobacteria bacterium]|nr:ribonuclease R [Deltaproteobacteria bacterium]
MAVDQKGVLRFLREEAGRPATLKDIRGRFGITKEKRSKLVRLLDEMLRNGEIVRIKGGRYGVPSKMNLVTGRLQSHAEGFGFVIPDEGDEDVYINARNIKDAMHGDRVVARVEGFKAGGKRHGSIIRIIERVHKTVVGRYEKGRKFGYVVPSDERLSHDIYVPKGEDMGADDGEVVLVELISYPTRQRNPEGVVIRVIGSPFDPEVEIQSIIARHNIPSIFPQEVIDEAERIGESVKVKEIEGREDLRNLMTVTIDGETARDFDDAVSVRKEGKGNIRLWVSIADVSHYVKEGSDLDREAYERGTSVYFPDRCIPMLPERLSNGICSLNPQVERLAMTAEMLFNDRGERIEGRFYPSVIRSDHRLTYSIVKKILVEGDAALTKEYETIMPDLRVMEELSGWLRIFREERGCIDFDLPEAQIILDIQGGVEAIVRSERNLAHMIIEEFMLAANEAVASFLAAKKLPLLYRVHEEPDAEKLEDFREFIHNLGYELKSGTPSPKDLQGLLSAVFGKPEERTINHVLLRSMKQAVYSGKNIGHFGLASKIYCHFTSPIRRYPDLMVHRVLKKAVTGGIKKAETEQLQAALQMSGEETSSRERRAMEAERDVVDLKKTEFMMDKVGENYSGFITGVTSFGIFVELEELFVEGLVHVTSIDDDYYIYDEKGHSLRGERKKRSFRIGDKVDVSVEKVDRDKRQIDFKLK